MMQFNKEIIGISAGDLLGSTAGYDAAGFVLLLTEINEPRSIFTFYFSPLFTLTWRPKGGIIVNSRTVSKRPLGILLSVLNDLNVCQTCKNCWRRI